MKIYLSLVGQTAESFDLQTSPISVVETVSCQLERTSGEMTQFFLTIDVGPLRSLGSYAVDLDPPSSVPTLLQPSEFRP
jgi:hypothetical protein